VFIFANLQVGDFRFFFSFAILQVGNLGCFSYLYSIDLFVGSCGM
jgi:hypothetical protein